MTVVDSANNIATASVTVLIRDGTKPIVGEIAAASSVIEGQLVTFTVAASDPESSTLRYTWDFDKEVDSDLDGVTGNDEQATGTSVSWTFTISKPTYVTCTVTNDANLSKTVQHLIDVEVDPASASGSSSNFNGLIPVIVILILAILGGGGWFAWRIRNKNLAREALALEQAAEEEESEQPEPEREDQLLMYATTGTQSYGGGDSIASLAGSDYGQVSVSADILDSFVDDDKESVEEKDPILDDLDFLRKRDDKSESTTKQEITPSKKASTTSGAKVAKQSSGIVLPQLQVKPLLKFQNH